MYVIKWRLKKTWVITNSNVTTISHITNNLLRSQNNCIKLFKGNRTEFYFTHHLKGPSQPCMMMLLPQFLDHCKESYRTLKFQKKRTKRVQVSVVFPRQKMKKLYLTDITDSRAAQYGIISHRCYYNV